MTNALDLIQRIFNPARYWRQQFRNERGLRVLAEAREVEAVHINEIRLNTILGHERGNAEMRKLLASAYTMIGSLERDLQDARGQLSHAVMRDPKTGRYLSGSRQ